MHYRQIVTFDFSDGFTRTSFEEMIEELGFVKAEDQSTWTLPFTEKMSHRFVRDKVKEWSQREDITLYSEDFVELFYADAISRGDGKYDAGISSVFLQYDSKSRSFK